MATSIEEIEPIHEKELRELCTCMICKEKIGRKPLPCFWKVRMERHFLDMNAVNRLQGLSMFMGSAQLASVMGPDEPLSKGMGLNVGMICDECIMERLPELLEGGE